MDELKPIQRRRYIPGVGVVIYKAWNYEKKSKPEEGPGLKKGVAPQAGGAGECHKAQ